VKALIVVDHGSQLEESNRLLEKVALRIAARGGYGLVKAAHMELAPPSVSEAFDACVAGGATSVTVAQYFLGPGRHATRDIPRLVEEAAEKHAGVTWRVTEPLGLSDRLIDAILEKAREAEGKR
jgi:sirohydrochlorin ferrochelatase